MAEFLLVTVTECEALGKKFDLDIQWCGGNILFSRVRGQSGQTGDHGKVTFRW